MTRKRPLGDLHLHGGCAQRAKIREALSVEEAHGPTLESSKDSKLADYLAYIECSLIALGLCQCCLQRVVI
jgi:hypothetical protein